MQLPALVAQALTMKGMGITAPEVIAVLAWSPSSWWFKLWCTGVTTEIKADLYPKPFVRTPYFLHGRPPVVSALKGQQLKRLAAL